MFDAQWAGDEAIFVPWPGYTGTPSPKSGRTISGLAKKREVRTIRDSSGKIIWAHKWRLNIAETIEAGIGQCCSVSFTSTDSKGELINGGNGYRCRDGKNITVTVNRLSSSNRIFDKWDDGNTDNPRTFTNMKDHINHTFTTKSAFSVKVYLLSDDNSLVLSTYVADESTLNFTAIKVSESIYNMITTMSDFVPSWVGDATNRTLDLTHSYYRGWTADGYIIDTATTTEAYTDLSTYRVRSNISVRCRWTRQFKNIFMVTSKAKNDTKQQGTFFLFQLCTTLDAALPLNGRLYVKDMYGLLTHTGSLSSHEMCVMVGVNDINSYDSTNRSVLDQQAKIVQTDNSWKLTQVVTYPELQRIFKVGSGYITLPSGGKPPSSSTTDVSEWDVFGGSSDKGIRPLAPRVTPLSFDTWYNGVINPLEFASSVTTKALATTYRQNNKDAGVYDSAWHACRTMFTSKQAVFDGDAPSFDSHIQLVSGGSYVPVDDSHVITLEDVLYVNYGSSMLNDAIYVVDNCSDPDDIGTGLPPARCEAENIDGTVYPRDTVATYIARVADALEIPDYGDTYKMYVQGIAFDDESDPDDMREITDRSHLISSEGVYYITIRGINGGNKIFVPINAGDSYAYPAFVNETVAEYKTRVAKYSAYITADYTRVYQQIYDTSNAIYVKKATEDTNYAAVVHYEGNSMSGAQITKLANGNPTSMHILMYKTNNCPVPWRFMLYNLEISMF